MARYVVALTGASGVLYGKRLVQEILAAGSEVALLISRPGWLVLEHEEALQADQAERLEVLRRWLRVGREAPLAYYENEDLLAPVASGSHRWQALIVVPASMACVAAVAHGSASNLIERTADVALKERRPLILVPREMPLSLVHLRNLVAAAEAGAIIAPAMPGFYHQPKTVDEVVDFVVGKVLDLLGIEHRLFRRWGGG